MSSSQQQSQSGIGAVDAARGHFARFAVPIGFTVVAVGVAAVLRQPVTHWLVFFSAPIAITFFGAITDG